MKQTKIFTMLLGGLLFAGSLSGCNTATDTAGKTVSDNAGSNAHG